MEFTEEVATEANDLSIRLENEIQAHGPTDNLMEQELPMDNGQDRELEVENIPPTLPQSRDPRDTRFLSTGGENNPPTQTTK